jgi:hypothetical protein
MTDTLKSICEQCIHLHNPQLEFLPESLLRQREIILRDLRELVSAASQEHEKTVVVLTGCIFESILYCFIQLQSDYITARRGVDFTFNPDHSLDNYVSVFNRYFSELLAIPDMVVDYRDVVHINRELKHPSEVCQTAAPEMLRLLDALLGTLTRYSQN